MTLDVALQYTSWCVYLLIFLVVALRALRRPAPASVDIVLFFADPSLIIGLTLATSAGWIAPGLAASAVNGSLLLALCYLLLRLVNDFTPVPRPFMYAASAGLILTCAGTFVFAGNQPLWYTLAAVIYFVVLQLYCVVAFVRHSRRSSGVTARRMQAAAAGSLFLGLIIVLAGLQVTLPQGNGLWQPLSELSGLASAVCYFLGFATPSVLRRAWQEPELRAFLGKAARLPRLPDTATIVRELERGAARSVGAPHASIGLWDAAEGVLRFDVDGRSIALRPAAELPGGAAFLTQQPVFGYDLERRAHEYADIVRTFGARASLAAPITAGDKRLGVLSVYAPRAPVFADDDLELVQLLADQAAVILESRALIDEAARVRAREEAARLKDDFLSAAAHDLKTPLTTLVAQSQYLQRQLQRDPNRPVNPKAIERLASEAQRLRSLVMDLLDAARAEQGRLLGVREWLDLKQVAEDICARRNDARHPCVVEASGPVVCNCDRMRITQLIENLVENAVKYSPDGGVVRVHIEQDNGELHLDVHDEGIGIPAADLPHIFDRFYRAQNVDQRSFVGMGLGLFICRAIAEQHGGQIWATSLEGQGTTFHVVIPAAREPASEEKMEHA